MHSDTLSPKAAASVRHDGVSSVRTRSADAGKTSVVLFVVVCDLPRLHSACFSLCDAVLFGAGSHKCCFYRSFLYKGLLHVFLLVIYNQDRAVFANVTLKSS